MKKNGFTLIEILVTLAVMGVVFAAVAPTVNTFNQERQDKVYKAKTGKAYSIISEALRAQFVSTQQRMLGNGAASNLATKFTRLKHFDVASVTFFGNSAQHSLFLIFVNLTFK